MRHKWIQHIVDNIRVTLTFEGSVEVGTEKTSLPLSVRWGWNSVGAKMMWSAIDQHRVIFIQFKHYLRVNLTMNKTIYTRVMMISWTGNLMLQEPLHRRPKVHYGWEWTCRLHNCTRRRPGISNPPSPLHNLVAWSWRRLKSPSPTGRWWWKGCTERKILLPGPWCLIHLVWVARTPSCVLIQLRTR